MSLLRRVFDWPLTAWRRPRGKPAFVVAAALAALWSGWLFTFQILILVAFWLGVIFDN